MNDEIMEWISEAESLDASISAPQTDDSMPLDESLVEESEDATEEPQDELPDTEPQPIQQDALPDSSNENTTVDPEQLPSVSEVDLSEDSIDEPDLPEPSFSDSMDEMPSGEQASAIPDQATYDQDTPNTAEQDDVDQIDSPDNATEQDQPIPLPEGIDTDSAETQDLPEELEAGQIEQQPEPDTPYDILDSSAEPIDAPETEETTDAAVPEPNSTVDDSRPDSVAMPDPDPIDADAQIPDIEPATGFAGETELEPISMSDSQSGYSHAGDQTQGIGQRELQAMEKQAMFDEDFASQLAEQLDDKFTSLRDHVTQTTFEYMEQQTILTRYMPGME